MVESKTKSRERNGGGMNWYQHIIQNMAGGSREVLNLANNIASLFVKADRGSPIEEHAIHSIISMLPSEAILQKSIELGLQISAISNGIRDMTAAREEVVRRINESLQNTDNTQEVDNDNELVEENNIRNDQTAQVQQEV